MPGISHEGKLITMKNETRGLNFQQLIASQKGTRSYESLSKAAGGFPKARGLQTIAKKGFTQMPTPATIQGLSRALNVSQRDLVLAAARTLGIDVEAENPNDLLLVGAGRLPSESQDLLKSISRELQDWMDGRRGEESEDASGDNVIALRRDRSDAPDFRSMAANTELRSEGKEASDAHDALGEESQEQ